MKLDRLVFSVNVKEFLCLFVTCEKSQYFYVNQFCNEDPLFEDEIILAEVRNKYTAVIVFD